jgi:uncharacterized membrane protein HdeD (DUF308 family)
MPLFKLLLIMLILGVVAFAARMWFRLQFTTRANLWGGSGMVLTVVGVLLLFTPLKGLAVLALVAALPLATMSALLREEERRGRKRKERET